MRTFRKTLGAALATLALVALAAAACSTQPTSPPAATPASPSTGAAKPTAAPAQAKPTGTLTAAINTMGNERWLAWQTAAATVTNLASTYDFLFRRDLTSDKILPSVATSYEVSPDGKTLTFKLRPGIQFHEGWGELTAEDVVYSLDNMRKQGAVGSRSGYFRDLIDRVEAPEKHQLVLRLQRPDPLVHTQLVDITSYMPIVSKKYVETAGEAKAASHPIGSGPYKFVEHKANQHIKLEAVENHWHHTPYFKNLIIKVVPEDAARLAMLRTGEADISMLPLSYKREAEAAKVRLISVRVGIGAFFHLGGQVLPSRNTYNPNVPWVGPTPERALKVRKALNLAVDMATIRKTLLEGEVDPIAVPFHLDGKPWTDPAWKPYPYDPQEAKRLLAEAGYPNGFEATMRIVPYAGFAEAQAVEEAVAQYWEKVGIKVKRVAMEYETHRADVTARKLAGVAWAISSGIHEEPATAYANMATSKGVNNYFMEDEAIDKLIQQAGSELDSQKRWDLQRRLGQYLYDNYSSIPIGIPKSLWGVGPKVGDWPVAQGFNYFVRGEYVKPKQ